MADKARGKSAEAQANAPGLQKSREFVAPDGSIVTATQAEYKNTLRAQGYRPMDDEVEETAGEETSEAAG